MLKKKPWGLDSGAGVSAPKPPIRRPKCKSQASKPSAVASKALKSLDATLKIPKIQSPHPKKNDNLQEAGSNQQSSQSKSKPAKPEPAADFSGDSAEANGAFLGA